MKYIYIFVIVGGIPVHKIGPIGEWWVTGYGRGNIGIIGVSTNYCNYYLMQPSEEYKEYMQPLIQKVLLTKTVVEFLFDALDPTYEELLNYLQVC